MVRYLHPAAGAGSEAERARDALASSYKRHSKCTTGKRGFPLHMAAQMQRIHRDRQRHRSAMTTVDHTPCSIPCLPSSLRNCAPLWCWSPGVPVQHLRHGPGIRGPEQSPQPGGAGDNGLERRLRQGRGTSGGREARHRMPGYRGVTAWRTRLAFAVAEMWKGWRRKLKCRTGGQPGAALKAHEEGEVWRGALQTSQMRYLAPAFAPPGGPLRGVLLRRAA